MGLSDGMPGNGASNCLQLGRPERDGDCQGERRPRVESCRPRVESCRPRVEPCRPVASDSV